MLATGVATRSTEIGVIGDTGTPVGINVAVGAVAVVAAGLVSGVLPAADTDWRFGLVVAAVGLFALLTVDPRAVAMVVPIAWLIVNGFLVNRLGELSWHGSADLHRLLLLVVIGVVGLTLGRLTRLLSEARERWRMSYLVQEMATELNKEGERRA